MRFRFDRIAICLAALPVLAGCVAPQQYMGIDISDAAVRADALEVRTIGSDSAEFLRRGLRMGCIANATGDQSPANADTPACREYVAQLLERTERASGPVTIAADASALPTPLLARRAQAGDKHAQLELGIRFEEGRGLPVDPDRARRLYELAATDSQDETAIYQAGVGDAPGTTLRIPRGPVIEGLPEARERLQALSDLP